LQDELKKYEHYEVLVNPYPDSTTNEHTCLVTMRKRVGRPGQTPKQQGSRNFLTQFAGQFEGFLELLICVVNKFPHLIPWMLDKTLKGMTVSQYINKSYHILLLELDSTATTGTATEVAFRMDDKYSYMKATEEILRHADLRRTIGNQYQAAPFSLRFVKGSSEYLAMTHGIDTCLIELDMLGGVVGWKEIMFNFQELAYKLRGRPHWGLQWDHLTGSNDLIKKMYSNFDKWMAVFKELNPKGTFNNPFTLAVGFSDVNYT